MNKLEYKYKKLSPFKLCVIENFPFIEADFDAITNYQLMCKIVEYINEVAKNNDIMIDNVEALNNWFNNLDVQSEINKKLDEMAQSGELTEIVTAYLQISGVLAYDNVETMKASNNLIDGSFAQTFGFYNINDGGGALYKVREVTNQDTIDNITLIALNNPDLVAELLYNNINVKQFGAKGDGVTDDTASIRLALSKGKNVVFPKGEYVTSSEITITSENFIIKGNGATIKPTHSLDCFNVNGNNIIIDSLNIDGGCNYGYDLGGSYCTIKNCNISNTLHNAIMITGSHNTIDNVVANLCGWDCVGNYGNASYNIINNCKAIKTKRHGFSTDPTTHHISFINCYCEDIGDSELVEGHSCYHFEGSNYGVVNNCKAVYTSNHKNMVLAGDCTYVGVRVYNSNNVLVDNINIIYNTDYQPLASQGSRIFEVISSNNFKMINSTIINNSNQDSVGKFYIASPIELINNYFKDVEMYDSDGYSGYISKMSECYIKNDYRTKFANFAYLCENAVFFNNKFIGNENLQYFLRGRFVNCLFENNIFDTGITSINLQQNIVNAQNKSVNNTIKNNIFKNLTKMVHIGVSDNASQNVYDGNLFTGTCETVVYGEYSRVKWINNKKYNLTYTNLKVNMYNTIYEDLTSNNDYDLITTNSSGARYTIRVDESGNVVASAI